MKRLLKSVWNDDRGNILVIAGAALPMLIGAAGLATDTIQWTLWKRQLQRAADSAAIAGVYGVIQGQTASAAVTTDLTYNNRTGITLVSGYPKVTQPSTSGRAWTDAVQVDLAVQKKLAFSSLFMSATPTIPASATAAVLFTGEYCVVSLENTAVTGITATGATNVDLGCGMITNSTSLNAAVAKGSATVDATPVAAVGNIQSSTNWSTGTTLLPFSPQQEDPYGSVTPTMPSSCTGASNLTINPQDTLDLSEATSAPCYKNVTVKGKLILPKNFPLYLDGGSFQANSTAEVKGESSTVVLSNSSSSTTATIGTVDINGSAKMNITAPTNGTYSGLVFYQDRRAVDNSSSSASSPNSINGNSSSGYTGAFYFPSQQVTFNGNADWDLKCVQLVARRVYFSGSSKLKNECENTGTKQILARSVRLVS